MATAVQVRANRANAQKSTGPRTAEGKERASRNAVKHGLLAREAVIAGEDPEEFEVYREGMLADLAPAGPVEAMLAERVVGLSWRLRRAERLQNEAFAALDDGTPTPLLDARLQEWKRVKGSDADRSAAGVAEDESPWGRVVVEDFTRARVLDRLLLYERRIESSLYRTMGELRRFRAEGQAHAAAETPDGVTTNLLAAAAEEVPRSENRLQAGEESVTPPTLGSFGANAVAGTETRKVTLGGPQTPAGVARGTGILPVVGNHGQDAHATETPAGVTTNESLRETKPIRPAGAISRHSSIPSFQPSSPMPVGQDNGAKQTRFGHSRGLGTGTV
jgi:hypothetical protein